MKITRLAALAALFFGATQYASIVIPAIEIVESPDKIERNRINFYMDQADYVEGGTTITYPDGMFTEAPIVSVSIQLKNQLYFMHVGYFPIIISNSATQSVIRINKMNFEFCQEAQSDDVTVIITACGR